MFQYLFGFFDKNSVSQIQMENLQGSRVCFVYFDLFGVDMRFVKCQMRLF